MTYDQIIEKVRLRGFDWLQGTRYYESGAVYDALHAAVRHIFHVTKQHEASATLSLVAGTRDYTISSSIASDADSIIYVSIDTGSIEPLNLREFQNEIFFDVDDEDDITAGTPTHYRVFNGVLRVYPTPGQAFSATVYYSKKIAPDFYTTAIGASSCPLADEYLESAIHLALGTLAENAGKFPLAQVYRTGGERLFAGAREEKTVFASGDIQYQSSV